MQDNSSELEALQKEAEEVIAKARAEASAKIQAAKKASEEEIQAAADEHKKVSLLGLPHENCVICIPPPSGLNERGLAKTVDRLKRCCHESGLLLLLRSSGLLLIRMHGSMAWRLIGFLEYPAEI